MSESTRLNYMLSPRKITLNIKTQAEQKQMDGEKHSMVTLIKRKQQTSEPGALLKIKKGNTQ